MLDPKDPDRYRQAAKAALEMHTWLIGIDDRDNKGKPSNEIAAYHLIVSLTDLAKAEGFDFIGVVNEVVADLADE